MSEKIYPIAIIGGGAAGVMATLRAILNNDEVLLFPGSPKNKKKSRAFWVRKVENVPGFEQYIKGIDDPNNATLKFIQDGPFAENLTLLKNRGVTEIKKMDGLFFLTDNKGEVYKAKHVVITTGVMDVQPTINGDIKEIFPYANTQIIDYCLRCDGHHTYGKKTSIIGHGEGAAWVAIMLYERYQHPEMSIITNGEEPQIGPELQKTLEAYNIKIINQKIVGIEGDPKAGELHGYQLENGDFYETEFSFVSLGMLVYNELATQLGASVDKRGFVLTNDKGESSVENLYIAGDLRANTKKQIYTAWDTAVDAADAINFKVRAEKRKKALGL